MNQLPSSVSIAIAVYPQPPTNFAFLNKQNGPI